MATVALDRINKSYGTIQALFDVSLQIEDGSFVVFVGPSGCGKSTLLRSIAGLEDISSGSIFIGGEDVSNAHPADRDVAMVFQSYALYPHMSVRSNMEFGMKVGGIDVAERRVRVADAARILQLEDYLDRKPAQLSGGQRQRVAIGRAIVKNPKVFLFDEPLSNLDAKLRIQMRVELEALHKQLEATMVYVTHDQVEAMTMADKIVVLNEGRIEQVGTPMQLYHSPASEFVAGFIGSPSMNFIKASDVDEIVSHDISADTATIGVRPEHLEITAINKGIFNAKVAVKEQLGGESYLYLKAATGTDIVVKTDGDNQTMSGEEIGINFSRDRVHQFDAAGATIQTD